VNADIEIGRYRAAVIDGIAITHTLVRRADHAPAPAVQELARVVKDEFARMIAEGMFGTPAT
jgi:hypothetical protein